jgi:glycosyltransferase involved in cell wall biosynthesis
MSTRKGVDVLLDIAEEHGFGDLVLEVAALTPEVDLLHRATQLEAAGFPVKVIAPILDTREHVRYLREVAVLAVPSLLEGFGMIAAEAQAVGVPVVGIDAGGLKESVLSGGGVLVPRGDRAALATAIQDLSTEDVAPAVREEIRARFSVTASTSAKRTALLNLLH